MVRDLIPLIPFPLIQLPKKKHNLFFMIKAMRVEDPIEKPQDLINLLKILSCKIVV